jgi:hypothetical protein
VQPHAALPPHTSLGGHAGERRVLDRDDVDLGIAVELGQVAAGPAMQHSGQRGGRFHRTAIDLGNVVPSPGERLAQMGGKVTRSYQHNLHRLTSFLALFLWQKAAHAGNGQGLSPHACYKVTK